MSRFFLFVGALICFGVNLWALQILRDTAPHARSLQRPQIQLWGTTMAGNAHQALAIIEESDSHLLRPCALGEVIQGWTLKEIQSGAIVLSRGDENRHIHLVDRLPEPQPSAAGSAEPPQAIPFVIVNRTLPPHRWLTAEQVTQLKAAITPLSTTERVVNRQKAAQVLHGSNPLRVVREAALQPAFSGRELVGVKLLTVPEEGVLHRSGFESGDVVHAVNGQPLTNSAIAFTLAPQLMQGDVITIGIERNGHPVTLTYHMQQ